MKYYYLKESFINQEISSPHPCGFICVYESLNFDEKSKEFFNIKFKPIFVTVFYRDKTKNRNFKVKTITSEKILLNEHIDILPDYRLESTLWFSDHTELFGQKNISYVFRSKKEAIASAIRILENFIARSNITIFEKIKYLNTEKKELTTYLKVMNKIKKELEKNK
jgi:hypothetical protein